MKQIKLTQGKFTIVDDKDYYLNQYKWYFCQGYARRTIYRKGKPRGILLHRMIVVTHSQKEVDHINGNKLDNRRSNLRLVTRQQNMFNQKASGKTSKYKGVQKLRNKWQATIGYNYKKIYLGFFNTEIEAARVYDKYAIKLHGKFVKLNIN